MKSVEVNGTNAVSRQVIDVTPEAQDVLKTLELLDASFGVNYLAGILRGEPLYEWKHVDHPQLETFGCLRNRSRTWVVLLIHHMADEGLVTPKEPRCAVIEITDKGREFMDSPTPFKLQRHQLRMNRYDYYLRTRLKGLRKDIASVESMPYYMIFSDYTLDRIVKMRPKNYQELKEIPGLKGVKADKYGVAIMSQMREIDEFREEESLERLKRNVLAPTIQETKKLFLEGKSVAEIAEAKEIKETTVVSYLSRLHQTGDIDLKPWIEETVDSKELYKGAEYFRESANAGMREAFETLGIDYDTLRLCKLYVSDYSAVTDTVTVQA